MKMGAKTGAKTQRLRSEPASGGRESAHEAAEGDEEHGGVFQVHLIARRHLRHARQRIPGEVAWDSSESYVRSQVKVRIIIDH